MRLIYFTSLRLPTTKAHVIQILKTCAALAKYGIDVELIVRELNTPLEHLLEECNVGADDHFTVSLFKGYKWISFLRRKGIFYTRSLSWAKRLLRLKKFHKNPVVFETHKKSLYYKYDLVTGMEKGLEDKGVLDFVYSHSDGVISAFNCTYQLLRERRINALHLWFGWTHDLPQKEASVLDVVYTGVKKELSVLLEAVSMVDEDITLHIYGSNKVLFKELLKCSNCKQNIVFHGYLSHGDLLQILPTYGIMIGLNEGLKLADYLSAGGPILAPNLPSVRDILGDAAYYFEFNSASSLASSIRKVIEDKNLYSDLRKRAQKRAILYKWPDKARNLIEFLNQFGVRS